MSNSLKSAPTRQGWTIQQWLCVVGIVALIVLGALWYVHHGLSWWIVIGLGLLGWIFRREREKHLDPNDPEVGQILLKKALRLERAFKNAEALALYEEVERRFAGQDSAHDAAISARQLRSKMGLSEPTSG